MALVDFTFLTPGPDLSNTDIMIDLSGPLDEPDFAASSITAWDAYIANTNNLSQWTTDPLLTDTMAHNNSANSMQDLSQFFSAEDLSGWQSSDSQSVQLASYDFSNQQIDLTTLDEPCQIQESSISTHGSLLSTDSGYESLTQDLSLESITVNHDSVSSPGSVSDENPAKITLTINNPSSLTVESLMKIAIGNKSGFRFEKD